LALLWGDVDLDAKDHEKRIVGEINLRAAAVKTKRARTVWLDHTPALRRLLAAMKLRSTGPHVFGDAELYTADQVSTARYRLLQEYGAPAFTWQQLRQTTSTYLTNAPGIFGAASAYRSARLLGHSVTVAETRYTGIVRISADAKTLEQAMQIEKLVKKIGVAVGERGGRSGSIVRVGLDRR
jgi:hypothetical protein